MNPAEATLQGPPLDPLSVPLEGTVLIEASAGTGKTHAITTLYLRLLLERELNVEQILVVTYTNAATAELRARIRRRLHETLSVLNDSEHQDFDDATLSAVVASRRVAGRTDRDRGRILRALHDFDQAAIFTIHGFCQRVLQEFAFESGVGFDVDLVADEQPLIDEVVRDFWVRQLQGAPYPLVWFVSEQIKNPLAKLDRLAMLITTHPEMPILPVRGAVSTSDLEATLASWRLARDELRQVWSRERSGALESIRRLGKKGNLRSSWQTRLDTELESDAPGFSQRCGALTNLGADSAFARAGKAYLAADECLLQVLANQWLELQLAGIEFARTELRRRKAEARQRSFADLLQCLAEALRAASGPQLAERIRARLPAALIDEFQDTDPLQYEIFRRIYRTADDAALFLIGDPKQAIYAFRGADVFAYLSAKNDAQVERTLLTNWRSDPSLTAALNALFARARAPFVLDGIPFRKVDSPPGATNQLTGTAAARVPLRILFVPRDGKGVRVWHNKIVKSWQHSLTRFVAADISRFLRSGALLQGRPVVAGDVAVLCRTNAQAVEMQEELRSIGLPSVLHGDASVFDSVESEEVGRVIRGVAEPGDTVAVRAALATTLLGQNASDIFALQCDERLWDHWLRRFQEWHELWIRRGFVVAFRALLDAQEVVPRLLGLVDGERRLTNVLHLMELLHAASVEEKHGPSALVHWLTQMRRDETARTTLAAEAAQIRLESDDAAVKLVTIHKSKGLQYPIVYCPYLWDGKLLHENDRQVPRFHDPSDGHRLKLDLTSPPNAAYVKIAEREALAESLRLLYVALTRAKHSCTVVWGAFNDCETSALGYILHPDREAPDPASGATSRISGFIKSKNDAGLRGDLDELVNSAAGTIVVNDLMLEPTEPWPASDEFGRQLSCRSSTRDLALRWRTASFSSLIRSSAVLSRPVEEGVDHDASAVGEELGPTRDDDPVVLHDFPAGTRTGQVLHGIFEHIDFTQIDPQVLHGCVASALDAGGVAGRFTANVATAIDDVLNTPLNDSNLRLRDVSREKRLNELEFIFPVAARAMKPSTLNNQLHLWTSVSMEKRPLLFTAKRLAEVFASHAHLGFVAEYANRLAQLDFAALSGFLKGFIDLVFEHGGRWYVVDYKSNRLGTTPSAYATHRLSEVMIAHDYILQYHLYVVALHRYLRTRLAAYDYNRHCGGVYYLFVRGMSPRYPPGNGIFHDQPPRRLVERLSTALDGSGDGR